MIPKIIHYCWFGGKQLPELAEKCIASWKKYIPEFEIKEWNESNYNVHKIPYTSEAYNAQKYAFVSDYARFDILYNYGGIYFDTDVEVIKSFDDILIHGGFMGFSSNKGYVASGLGLGCEAGLDIIHQILDFYSNLHFINPDDSYNLQTVVVYVTAILEKNGLRMENRMQNLDGLTIYPVEYFGVSPVKEGKTKITNNSHSIHYGAGSWLSDDEIKFIVIKMKYVNTFGLRIGKIIAIISFLFLCISHNNLKLFFHYINGFISNRFKK